MDDWLELTRRASFVSHRVIGWIYWDPRAIQLYSDLGVENGFGYYVASRAAPLLPAGHQAVAAAFYSIHPTFVQVTVEAATSRTTWEQIYDARNRAVGEGLRTLVPEFCERFAELGPALWAAADRLPESGRVLFAVHRQAPRVDDPVVSAWLALNCLREWRGDTHFAVLAANDIDRVQAGILHDAHLNYGGWIPRSRGADDAAIGAALAGLAERGLADRDGVNAAGLARRAEIEATTDRLCVRMWREVGRDVVERFVSIAEPVGPTLLRHIDETAGPDWMPAARERRSSS